LFLKFTLRLPYRQTEGVTRKTFGRPGIKIPNFGTLHYRLLKGEFSLKEFASRFNRGVFVGQRRKYQLCRRLAQVKKA